VSDQERDAKFIDCASTILDDSQSADLLDQIKDIRAADDVRALVKATIPLG
jgi:hypothetical protein